MKHRGKMRRGFKRRQTRLEYIVEHTIKASIYDLVYTAQQHQSVPKPQPHPSASISASCVLTHDEKERFMQYFKLGKNNNDEITLCEV